MTREEQICDRAREHVAKARESLGPAFSPLIAAIEALIDVVAGTAAKPTPLLTRRQAAALLGISQTSFDRLVIEGMLAPVMLPSPRGEEPIRRWTQATIDAFISRSSRNAA